MLPFTNKWILTVITRSVLIHGRGIDGQGFFRSG
jgi:hypothetical protein